MQVVIFVSKHTAQSIGKVDICVETKLFPRACRLELYVCNSGDII